MYTEKICSRYVVHEVVTKYLDRPLPSASANFQLGRSPMAADGWGFILAATTQAVA